MYIRATAKHNFVHVDVCPVSAHTTRRCLAEQLCDDAAFRDKVLNVRAMAGAWDSRNNLFANQFNVGADLDAATFILGKDSELTCTRTL